MKTLRSVKTVGLAKAATGITVAVTTVTHATVGQGRTGAMTGHVKTVSRESQELKITAETPHKNLNY